MLSYFYPLLWRTNSLWKIQRKGVFISPNLDFPIASNWPIIPFSLPRSHNRDSWPKELRSTYYAVTWHYNGCLTIGLKVVQKQKFAMFHNIMSKVSCTFCWLNQIQGIIKYCSLEWVLQKMFFVCRAETEILDSLNFKQVVKIFPIFESLAFIHFYELAK